MSLKEVSDLPETPKRWRISLGWVMIFSFGGLVAISLAIVLFLSVGANFANTYSLLNERAFTLVSGMERSIRSETKSAERLVTALARLYRDDAYQIGDLNSQRALLKSLLIASPVVEVVIIYDLKGNRTGIFRAEDGIFIDLPPEKPSESEIEALRENAKRAKNVGPLWGEPVFINKVLFHNVGLALTSNGITKGYVVAAIGRKSMNQVITNLGDENDTTVFMLDSDGALIAHSKQPEVFKGKRNIPLSDFPDPALREFANAKPLEEFNEAGEDNADNNLRVYEAGRGMFRKGHVYITRSLDGYSNKPYTLGAYYEKKDIGEEIQRAMISGLAGLVALVVAVLAAAFLARRLTRPMNEMANIASDFSQLNLENYKPLDHSRVREIDDQSQAFNSMHTALEEFSHYVPRKLVKRLMLSGKEATRSVEREVTVMFSDIVGFTTISETLNAAETAKLLNFHFDLVCGQISANKGTVDKFMGDGVMAFWGAPDADEMHSENAILAAKDIVEHLSLANQERVAEGLEPIRLRIGIHTGRAVVGNIGSCDRQNYTIVGDAVNIANRLEQLGKQLMKEEESIVLVSQSVQQASNHAKELVSAGNFKLRGRNKDTRVFRLVDSGEALETLDTSTVISKAV